MSDAPQETSGTLVEPEGVNAASARSTDEEPGHGGAPAGARSGGRAQDAPSTRGDGVSDQDAEMAGTTDVEQPDAPL